MKKVVILAIMGFSIVFLTGNAEALLLGDTITLAHYHPNLSTVYRSAVREVVATDDDQWSLDSFYTVFPEDCGVEIDFTLSTAWSTSPFNGLVVSDIDAIIQSVTVDTNMVGWDASRLSFDDHVMRFNWAGLSFVDGVTYFDADINECGGGVVPEPSSLLLLGLGLFGTGFFRRRKK